MIYRLLKIIAIKCSSLRTFLLNA